MQLADRIGRRLKLRDLNILLAVAQAGSMVKAAEHLAVSQPVVSKAISELEAALGTKLFDRVAMVSCRPPVGALFSIAVWPRSTSCGRASNRSKRSMTRQQERCGLPRPSRWWPGCCRS